MNENSKFGDDDHFQKLPLNEDRHLPEATETSGSWRNKPRNRPDKDEKHLAYSVLIANGISREKAATMLGYSAKSARTIDRALKEKGLKLVLLSEQRIKKAHRVIDKCLAGKPFGEVETIKDSTALRAAEVILDRSDPKRSDADAAPSVSFVTVNLGYMGGPSAPDPVPAALGVQTIEIEAKGVDVTPRLDEDKGTDDES